MNNLVRPIGISCSLRIGLSLIAAIALAFSSAGSAPAQSTHPAAAKPPAFPVAPPRSAWKVVYEANDRFARAGAAEAPAKADALAEIAFIKFDGRRRTLSKWTSGKTSEVWIIQGSWLARNRRSPKIVAIPFNDNTSLQTSLAGDFREIAWVSPATYRGRQHKDGVECDFFEENSNTGTGGVRRAWISAETHLPVAGEDERFRYRYAFEPAPGEAPQLPKDFAQALAELKKS